MRAGRETVVASRFTLQTAFGVLVAIGVLYLGREVLIPITLALLLSFFLSPPMVRLQRWGLGKTFSALFVVILFFLGLTLICWVGFGQAYNLSLELPSYRNNISAKFRSLTPPGLKHLEETQRMFNDVSGELSKDQQAKLPPSQRPLTVEVRAPAPAPLDFLKKTLGSLLGSLATAFVVLVFLIFILLGREDLRDRALRLAGSSRLYVTTQVFDDAARRVSRYLLLQLAVNAVYGLVVGLGLFLIGIPHPLVWSGLAALLRFIPYVGPWIAAAAPMLLAIGVAPGWDKFAWTAGLYVILELVAANVVEPILYGSSTGISPIAILVAAVFWTWLWGPIGLLLSTPLTVCVVVIGRYVPHLEFLGILFGDEPALSPTQRFYQRMIAMEAEDAAELIEQLLKNKELVDVYDNVIIPAMSLLEEGRHAGFLDVATEDYVLQNTRELMEELGPIAIESAKKNSPSATVICVPAKDAADELACSMLAQLLPDVVVQILPLGISGDELVRAISAARPILICVSGVPPQAIRQVAVRCRHLRRLSPDTPIMAAVWSDADLATIRERIPVNDANHVVCTLKQAVEYVREIAKMPGKSMVEVANTPADAADQIAELELLSSADGDFQEVLDGILQNLVSTLGAPMGVVQLTQEGGKSWRSQCGVPDDLIPILSSLEHVVAISSQANRSTIVIEDLATDTRFGGSKLSENGIQFCACQPLRDTSGKIIGSLLVLDTRARIITEQEDELLGATAVAVVGAQEIRTVGSVPESSAS